MISLCTLMTGICLDCLKHCKLEFGDCCQVCGNTTNTMTLPTVGGMCLGQAGNMQSRHEFMSLVTGRKISRPNNKLTKLPAINKVIQ